MIATDDDRMTMTEPTAQKPRPLFNAAEDHAMSPVKRLVAWIVRGTIISLFLAIIGTIIIFTGYAETGEAGAPWLDHVTRITGFFWGLVLLLLIALPIPLFLSLKQQRNQKRGQESGQ